jgi:catechol 2,3-dioxygenase-like lactoylglutathione lyase family enzyme
MAIQLNHTIVHTSDRDRSAAFLTELFGLAPARPYGPFLVVELDNGVSLDYVNAEGAIAPQHYAFLVSEDGFTEIFDRIVNKGLDYWAEPRQVGPGEINRRDGGRGVYFPDPDGHKLEILTRPYGSGG